MTAQQRGHRGNEGWCSYGTEAAVETESTCACRGRLDGAWDVVRVRLGSSPSVIPRHRTIRCRSTVCPALPPVCKAGHSCLSTWFPPVPDSPSQVEPTQTARRSNCRADAHPAAPRSMCDNAAGAAYYTERVTLSVLH
eukprot:2012006-Pyramimonas_sp.AAC.1